MIIANMAAGYSSNPLYKKLGLKEGFTVKLINPPNNYKDLIEPISKQLVFNNKATTDLDFIHFFTNAVKDLERQLPLLKQQIKKNGIIWISWYKQNAKKPTELSENNIRDIGLAIGLVDVKVCAVDENWSGLKLVFRVKDR
jgi:hypothetical protein